MEFKKSKLFEKGKSLSKEELIKQFTKMLEALEKKDPHTAKAVYDCLSLSQSSDKSVHASKEANAFLESVENAESFIQQGMSQFKRSSASGNITQEIDHLMDSIEQSLKNSSDEAMYNSFASKNLPDPSKMPPPQMPPQGVSRQEDQSSVLESRRDASLVEKTVKEQDVLVEKPIKEAPRRLKRRSDNIKKHAAKSSFIYLAFFFLIFLSVSCLVLLMEVFKKEENAKEKQRANGVKYKVESPKNQKEIPSNGAASWKEELPPKTKQETNGTSKNSTAIPDRPYSSTDSDLEKILAEKQYQAEEIVEILSRLSNNFAISGRDMPTLYKIYHLHISHSPLRDLIIQIMGKTEGNEARDSLGKILRETPNKKDKVAVSRILWNYDGEAQKIVLQSFQAEQDVETCIEWMEFLARSDSESQSVYETLTSKFYTFSHEKARCQLLATMAKMPVKNQNKFFLQVASSNEYPIQVRLESVNAIINYSTAMKDTLENTTDLVFDLAKIASNPQEPDVLQQKIQDAVRILSELK